MERTLTETEVAEMLQVSVRTVKAWRRKGIGPHWRLIGQHSVRYLPEDIRAYLDGCMAGQLPYAWRTAMKRAAAMLQTVAEGSAAGSRKRAVLADAADGLRKILEAPYA